MNEYAIRFFLLCRQAARLRAIELLELAEIESLPHLKKNARTEMIQTLQKRSQPEKIHDVNKDRETLRRIIKGNKL